MFNVLSGLQDGSRSVVIVSRKVNSGTFVKGNVVVTAAGTGVQAAVNTDYAFLEFVFEDLTGNSSGSLTTIYGTFEGETDQIDDATNGAIAADSLLTAVAGKIAKAAAGDITAGNVWGKCISTRTAVDMVKGSSAKVVTFRTKN